MTPVRIARFTPIHKENVKINGIGYRVNYNKPEIRVYKNKDNKTEKL